MKNFTLKSGSLLWLLTIILLLPSASLEAATYQDDFVGGRTDFRDEMIYFAMTTRFYDGDSSNNWQCWDNQEANQGDPCWRGDFKGLIEKMDYIKALGFTTIWITPIVTNASGYDYHGYHAVNFSEVDKRYESQDVDFQTVIDEAHKRGMKIVLDIVLNHTGNFGEENLCKLFTRDWSKNQATIDDCMVPLTQSNGGKLPDNYLSLPGAQQYSSRLVQMKNTDGVNHDSRNLWHHFAEFNWDLPNRWWAQIAGDCVDLNTENPATYKYLRSCYGKFIEMGVDGFRIDTGGHIARLTFNRAFIPYFKQLGEQYKSKRLNGCPFYMYAEVCARFQGSTTYRSQPCLSPYFYTWASDAKYQWDDTEESWQNLVIPCSSSESFQHLNMQQCVLEGQDYSSSFSVSAGNKNCLLNGNDYHQPDYTKASGLNVIDFPVHYSFSNIGNIWGLFNEDYNYNDASFNVVYVDSHDYGPGPNDGTRFNNGTSQWAENLDLMFTFRGIPCLYYGSEIEFRKGSPIDLGPNGPLSNTGRAYFGGYIKGDVTPTGFGSYTSASGNVAATLSNPLAKHIQRLSQIRQKVPALRKGQYSFEGCKASNGYAFKRRYTAQGTDSYALVSINSGATFTGVLNGTYTDCVSGDQKIVTNGTLTTRSFSGQGQMCVYVLNGIGKVGEDGKFLFSTSSVTPSQTNYDGTEEEASTHNGEGTDTPVADDKTLDELEVYTPSVTEDEKSVFYEAAANVNSIYVWVWNNTANFTGGSWDNKPQMTLMGKTQDGTRKIYKWTYDGAETTMPAQIIFVTNGTQTADLAYVNHGYYIDGTYSRTIEADQNAVTLSVDNPSGTYKDVVTVTLQAKRNGSVDQSATVVYTLDNSQPTAQSPQFNGQKTFTFTTTTNLKAAVLEGTSLTSQKTFAYTISSNVEEKTHAYFIDESDWGDVYVWAWRDNGPNFTGGSWPGVPATRTDIVKNGHAVWEWVYNGTLTEMPEKIIFSNHGKPQTADLIFENGAWYNAGGRTTAISAIQDEAGKDGKLRIYSLTGALYATANSLHDALYSLKKGVYIINGKKYIVK